MPFDNGDPEDRPKAKRNPRTVLDMPSNPDVEDVSPVPMFSRTVSIRILNTDAVDGKVVVLRNDNHEAYLVQLEKLQYTIKDQEVDEAVLLNAERPYNFEEQFRQFYTDPQNLRIALWQSGIATQEQAETVGIKQLLKNMIARGLFPMTENK